MLLEIISTKDIVHLILGTVVLISVFLIGFSVGSRSYKGMMLRREVVKRQKLLATEVNELYLKQEYSRKHENPQMFELAKNNYQIKYMQLKQVNEILHPIK